MRIISIPKPVRAPALWTSGRHGAGPLPHAGAGALEKLDTELQGSVKICKVDVDENPGLAQRFGVSSIPTLVVIRDGKAVKGVVGLA